MKDKLSTSHLQFAYKSDSSTALCTFLVIETIQYYRSRGSSVYALLLDATKAFDKVKFSKLFELLITRNVCPLLIRLLLNMYILNNAVVKWNGEVSGQFIMTNGVKQGGVLSPLLFSIYVDPLIDKLNDSNLGCHMGNICCNSFMYADDVIILSPTLHALKKLTGICENFGTEYSLTFNPTKCVLMIFSNEDLNTDDVKLTMNGREIAKVNGEKHLGHMLSNHGNIINIDSIIRDMKVRTNTIINQFHPVSRQSNIKLFNSQCLSLYGCPLWNLNDHKLEELYKTWRICCRRLLELDPRTKSYVLPHIMNSFDISDIIKERFINFFIGGVNHKSVEISNFFKNTLVSCSSIAVTNIKLIQF